MKQHIKNYSLLYVSLLIGVIYLIPSFAHAFSDPVQVQIGATNHPIRNVWTALLDFSNVVALIFFLGIAFANLLRIQISVYGIKKILPSLIVGIILANFSLLICQLLLDLSGAAAGLFEEGRGFLGFWVSSTDVPTADASFIREILSAGLKIVAAIMVMILAIMMILRNYIIMFLVVFSPIAFLSMSVPASKSIWTRWWKAFSQWTFMLPVAMFWLWVGANFFQFTEQFDADKVAFFSGIGLAGYAFGMICVYLAMTTPFRMAGELQSIAKKVQSTALTGIGVYAGARAAQQWGQNRADSTKAHLISYTGIGNLVRGAQLDKAASKTKMDLALAGPVHRDVGKFKLPKILGGKEMAVSDTWKWFRPLSAFGLGSKGADRLSSEAEVRKKDLESQQKEARTKEAGINGRYGRARRQRATTAEQAAERAKGAETDEIMKLRYGENYREYKNIEKEIADESYVRFHNIKQNTPDDKDAQYDAIITGLQEKYEKEYALQFEREITAGTITMADIQAKAKDKIETVDKLFAKGTAGWSNELQKKTVLKYDKRYNDVQESSKKLNHALNGKNEALPTLDQIQGLRQQYTKSGEGQRAVEYRQAFYEQQRHEMTVKKREQEFMASDTMDELHNMLQGQELNKLLDELSTTTSDIENVIKGTITITAGRQKQLEEKLFALVKQMKKEGHDMSSKKKLREKANAYRDKIKENPDYFDIMQNRMHYEVLSGYIGGKAKTLFDGETATETARGILDNTTKQQRGFMWAGEASLLDPKTILQLQVGTQTMAVSKNQSKIGPEYSQFLQGLSAILKEDADSVGSDGVTTLEKRIDYIINKGLTSGTAVPKLYSPVAKIMKNTKQAPFQNLLAAIDNAASDPSQNSRNSIATYLEQLGLINTMAMSKTAMLDRNNLIAGPDASGNIEPEKHKLSPNY